MLNKIKRNTLGLVGFVTATSNYSAYNLPILVWRDLCPFKTTCVDIQFQQYLLSKQPE